MTRHRLFHHLCMTLILLQAWSDSNTAAAFSILSKESHCRNRYYLPPPPIEQPRWRVGTEITSLLPTGSSGNLLKNRQRSRYGSSALFSEATSSSAESKPPPEAESANPSTPTTPESEAAAAAAPMSIQEATDILRSYDTAQQSFMQSDGMRGMGGGTSALTYLQTKLTSTDRDKIKQAVVTLINQAHIDRAADRSKGRIMLGICAENAPEALGGLKSWVSTLALPRGMLHGMDVDGVPIPPEQLGSVYVKFSTGGAMTFKQMRATKMGFDALWRPGDALLEPYDGAFRGVYLNVELAGDDEFRQFGVLPTDLFMDLEEDW